MPGIPPFSRPGPVLPSVEEGRKQIEKLICSKEFTNTEVSEEEKEPIITVHNLGKTFSDGFHALIDVNANVAKGKVVAILRTEQFRQNHLCKTSERPVQAYGRRCVLATGRIHHS